MTSALFIIEWNVRWDEKEKEFYVELSNSDYSFKIAEFTKQVMQRNGNVLIKVSTVKTLRSLASVQN